MNNINIAVVDDSIFMRCFITDMINSFTGYKVLKTFKNGQELINALSTEKIDVITLDLNMPVLDGIETLRELNKMKCNIPVIVLSGYKTEYSSEIIECLENGAIDFITKPSGNNYLNISLIKEELLEKLQCVVGSKCKVKLQSVIRRNIREYRCEKDIKAIVIGASTGGPKALKKILPLFDETINKPIFVVQHMPEYFTGAFANRLNKICKLTVKEARDGEKIENNIIYIAKGGKHLLITRDNKIVLEDSETVWGVKPAVDKLFVSAVKSYDGKVLSCVLTGMGCDGAYGTKVVKEYGGITMCESEESSLIYSMPKHAVDTGMIDYSIKTDNIAYKILEIIKGV
ncbi:MAG: chemotaxis-specific protein-glutamate methyltransferase CheB [Clostridium sp.]|uniref:chemotaxis-specific protein-glutamate methyltransferase CheB n=1 Tax=Clostridium sp. TaxID=1506 RepID=UPI003F320067